MILVILLTALFAAVLLTQDSLDLSFDWQAFLPMLDDTLTLIGLLFALAAYVFVIVLRYNRIVTSTPNTAKKPRSVAKKSSKTAKPENLRLEPLIIHNLNQ